MGEKFTIPLNPDSILTLSTSNGQTKGSYSIPPSKPFPFPHNDDFECESASLVFNYSVASNINHVIKLI